MPELPEVETIARGLAKRVTGAITEVTGLPKEAVWVVIEEVNPHDWYAAGKPGEPLKK